jgi:hypothetical protein
MNEPVVRVALRKQPLEVNPAFHERVGWLREKVPSGYWDIQLENNSRDNHIIDEIYMFIRPYDAILFKLTWGGKGV